MPPDDPSELHPTDPGEVAREVSAEDEGAAEDGTAGVHVGDVLEDANGYCLFVGLVEEDTFWAHDAPEQIHDPCLRVMRQFRNVPEIHECFVVRPARPDEIARFQRSFGEMSDGIVGPRTQEASRVVSRRWETVGTDGGGVRWHEHSEGPDPPSRFDREVDVGSEDEGKSG